MSMNPIEDALREHATAKVVIVGKPRVGLGRYACSAAKYAAQGVSIWLAFTAPIALLGSAIKFRGDDFNAMNVAGLYFDLAVKSPAQEASKAVSGAYAKAENAWFPKKPARDVAYERMFRNMDLMFKPHPMEPEFRTAAVEVLAANAKVDHRTAGKMLSKMESVGLECAKSSGFASGCIIKGHGIVLDYEENVFTASSLGFVENPDKGGEDHLIAEQRQLEVKTFGPERTDHIRTASL